MKYYVKHQILYTDIASLLNNDIQPLQLMQQNWVSSMDNCHHYRANNHINIQIIRLLKYADII